MEDGDKKSRTHPPHFSLSLTHKLQGALEITGLDDHRFPSPRALPSSEVNQDGRLSLSLWRERGLDAKPSPYMYLLCVPREGTILT